MHSTYAELRLYSGTSSLVKWPNLTFQKCWGNLYYYVALKTPASVSDDLLTSLDIMEVEMSMWNDRKRKINPSRGCTSLDSLILPLAAPLLTTFPSHTAMYHNGFSNQLWIDSPRDTQKYKWLRASIHSFTLLSYFFLTILHLWKTWRRYK